MFFGVPISRAVEALALVVDEFCVEAEGIAGKFEEGGDKLSNSGCELAISSGDELAKVGGDRGGVEVTNASTLSESGPNCFVLTHSSILRRSSGGLTVGENDPMCRFDTR